MWAGNPPHECTQITDWRCCCMHSLVVCAYMHRIKRVVPSQAQRSNTEAIFCCCAHANDFHYRDCVFRSNACNGSFYCMRWSYDVSKFLTLLWHIGVYANRNGVDELHGIENLRMNNVCRAKYVLQKSNTDCFIVMDDWNYFRQYYQLHFTSIQRAGQLKYRR